MPKKLINTLKYGNRKTKNKLYLMFGILVVGTILLAVSVILNNALLGLVAFCIIFADGIILFNTSFTEKTVLPDDEEQPGALEWIFSEKKEEAETKTEKENGENPLLLYDEKKLKKLFVTYKVKKHHVPVMIDMCQAEKIVQSPAYMWNDSTYLYFLVLGEEPRLIKSGLSESRTIHIRRGMTARPMEEYSEMNEPSVVSMIFGGLLPKYYKVDNGPYRSEFRKYLYSAAPGIWCTSASVKNMLKILPEHFELDDGKTEGENEFYKEIYIARVMFWDGVYSGQEYKEKVLDVLGQLIRAEISDGTVNEYINAMVMKGLIPREYAEYVFSKRRVK